MQHAIRRMSKKHGGTGGSIVLLSSVAADIGGPNEYVWYAASKGAVESITYGLSKELAGDGIRVNCVNPERTATPMRTKAFGQEPAGSLLSSEVVARTSLDVLLSELTGHVIDVRQQDPTAAAGKASGFEQALASVLDRQDGVA